MRKRFNNQEIEYSMIKEIAHQEEWLLLLKVFDQVIWPLHNNSRNMLNALLIMEITIIMLLPNRNNLQRTNKIFTVKDLILRNYQHHRGKDSRVGKDQAASQEDLTSKETNNIKEGPLERLPQPKLLKCKKTLDNCMIIRWTRLIC